MRVGDRQEHLAKRKSSKNIFKNSGNSLRIINFLNMSKPKVYIARKIPTQGLEELLKKCDVKMHKSQNPPSKKQLISYAKSSDAIMTSVEESVDKDVLSANPYLKIVANYAIGYNNIDLKTATERGIFTSNAPSPLAADAVAQHAMALILCLGRKISQSDKYTKQRKYKAWDPLLFIGDDMRGKTLGIIGVGRIGSSLVKIAKFGYEMNILYNDVIKNTDIEKNCKAKKVDLEKLLLESDYVSVHVPLLASTKHLISKNQISKMKKTAFLINTSRGPVVNEKDLLSALVAKKIAGAGLDVFEFEPNPLSGLLKMDNVILTPHTASATNQAREEMAKMASDNILDVLVRFKAPRNQIKA